MRWHFYVFCAPHHMLSVTPSLQKLHSIWNGIFGGPCAGVHDNHVPPQTKTKILHSTWNGIFYVFCAPHHMLSVTPSLPKLHSIWNGIFGGPCTPVHVNHVPLQTKTKILHSTWNGIFYVFCAPHHMLSVTPSLQKLHSIWNGIFGGPCTPVHVNHVTPQTKTKILHSTWNSIFYVFCAPHHMLSMFPSLQKLHSIWNGIFGGPCTPVHVNHVPPPPKQKQKYFVALEMAFFMCSMHHTTCYQWPLAYKNSIASEMAYSVGHVPLYTLTMYPPNKNKNTS